MGILKHVPVVATASALVGLWPSPAPTQEQVASDLRAPLQGVIEGRVEFDCEHDSGPQITFDGGLLFLGRAPAPLLVTSDAKKTQERIETVTVDDAALSLGDTIVIPKQPSHGGVGGNPFIWLQLLDEQGRPLTAEIYLGRCVQGPVSTDVLVRADVVADIVVMDSIDNAVPYAILDGAFSFTNGVLARLIFRNNDNPVGGPHEIDAISEMTIVPAGYTISLPHSETPTYRLLGTEPSSPGTPSEAGAGVSAN